MSQDEKRKDGVKSSRGDGVKKNRVQVDMTDYPESVRRSVSKREGKRQRQERQLQEVEPDEDLKRIYEHDLTIFNWGDVVMKDPDAVKARIVDYLELCRQDEVRPTVAGLAFSLGIDRLTLLRYREGILGKNEEVRVALKRAIDFINSQMESWFTSGKINPVAAIFLMKNNMQYRDQTEILVNQTAPLGQDPDQKQLEEKYLNSIVLNEDEIEKHMDND